ncbi:hypothetical protein [Cesiribacter andamanensis]|nr:hypothetical protein [Cesiribacter andamanensis]
MAGVFFIPDSKHPLLALGLGGLLLVLAIGLSYTTYALRLTGGGKLEYGLAFFTRFYPHHSLSPEVLNSMCIRQLPDKHWGLQLIPPGQAPLLLDTRPTLDALQKRRQQLEQLLASRMAAAAKW